MPRKKIIVGNWKMNKNAADAHSLMSQLLDYKKQNNTNTEIWIAPPSLYLVMAKELFEYDEVGIFAQDVSSFTNGAYTGEISAEMLKSIGIMGSIIGHSERRQYHGESDKQCNEKIKLILERGLTPIYCNGETQEERNSGKYFDTIRKQTETALLSFSSEEIKKIIIAYEPVWAIGTGINATPEQAQEIHAYIRNSIAEKYGKETANIIPILYGGSVKPDNAREIFSQPDIDGGLIGGASLKAEDFFKIIETLG